MRRKPGELLPLEFDILGVAASVLSSADPWLHGYGLARLLAAGKSSQQLTAHGTLYKALGRLADSGLLEQEWEDPDIAIAEGRPRRRLYLITGLGQVALELRAREDVIGAGLGVVAPRAAEREGLAERDLEALRLRPRGRWR